MPSIVSEATVTSSACQGRRVMNLVFGNGSWRVNAIVDAPLFHVAATGWEHFGVRQHDYDVQLCNSHRALRVHKHIKHRAP